MVLDGLKIICEKTELFTFCAWLGGLLVDCVTVQSMFLITIIKLSMNVAEKWLLLKRDIHGNQ